MPGIDALTISLEPHPRNPRARVRILSGQDDGHSFEVQVPLRIKTVEAALDWLRPAGVPADVLRQGEFYFLPSAGPHAAAGCFHPADNKVMAADCGGEEVTEGGSNYRWTVDWHASFSPSHTATRCYSVTKSGDVAFVGRRKMRTHSFTARPSYFVAGTVEHPEHGTLELPAHGAAHRGVSWYEVRPNKAHGPFPVRGYGRGD